MSNFSRQVEEKKDRKERDKTRKDKDMAALFGYSLIGIIAVGFWLFTETKAGKKWINSL